MTAARSIARRYGDQWRRAPQDLTFLLGSLPLAILGFTVTITGFALAAGLAIIWVGLPLLAGTLILARWFGGLELTRLRFAGHQVASPRRIVGGGLRAVLSEPRNWMSLLHAGIVGFVVGLTTWTLAISWVSIGIGGLTYALWGGLDERSTESVWLHTFGLETLPWYTPASDLATLIVFEILFQGVLGVVFLITLPFVAHGLIRVHVLVAKAMLTATPSSPEVGVATAFSPYQRADVLA